MMAVEVQHKDAQGINQKLPHQGDSSKELDPEVNENWEDQTTKRATPASPEAERTRKSYRSMKSRENVATPPEENWASRSRRHSDAISRSVESVTQEQQWFQNFMVKLEALEKRNQEMVSKDVDYELSSQNTEAALVEAENKFRDYRAALEKIPKDNDRIDGNIKEVDLLQERIEELIARHGWEETNDAQRAGFCAHYLKEISAPTDDDVSDEMSDVTFGSHCQSTDSSVTLETKPLLPYLPAWKQSSASVEPTVETEITSKLYMSFFEDDEDGSPTCNTFIDDDSVLFGDSDLLHDADFMLQNGKDLLVAPTPLVTTTDDDSEKKSDKVFCFPTKRRNDEQECEFCVIQ